MFVQYNPREIAQSPYRIFVRTESPMLGDKLDVSALVQGPVASAGSHGPAAFPTASCSVLRGCHRLTASTEGGLTVPLCAMDADPANPDHRGGGR